MSRDVTWAYYQRDMWLDECESLSLSHCANFDAFRSCRSGNKTILFCHVTSSDHMIKVPCDFVNGSLSTKVTTVASLMLIDLVEVKVFILSCDITLPNDQRDMWLCKREPLNQNHHCYAYRSCVRRDIFFLFCRVTSRDQIIKVTWDLLNGSPPNQDTSLPKFLLIGILLVLRGDTMFLFCHETLCQHMIKETCDLLSGSPLT